MERKSDDHRRDVQSEHVPDFTFAFNVSSFSDRVLRVEIVDEFEEAGEVRVESMTEKVEKRKRRRVKVEDCEAFSKLTAKLPTQRIKNIPICSAILASKSPFFLKLFSNGMEESSQTHFTIRIKASEEEAFMDLLHFMYCNTLRQSTEHALMDVLMMADRFEVASCMIYCSQKVGDLKMSLESALLYLDLQSKILMPDAIKPLVNAAKQFLTSRYNDITKCAEEVLHLPLVGFETVLASDDLCVPSEDYVFDLMMKYIKTNYPSVEERQNILTTRLCHVIRFSYVAPSKLHQDMVNNPDFNAESIYKTVLTALVTKPMTQRSYTLIPIKVMRFNLSQHRCVVYFDLKRDQCVKLFPADRVYSQPFDFNQHTFSLIAGFGMIIEQSKSKHFGFYLKMNRQGTKVCPINYKFSVRTNPGEDFEYICSDTHTFIKGRFQGFPNLVNLPWSEFIAVNSKYFVNGTLHLRAELKVMRNHQ